MLGPKEGTRLHKQWIQKKSPLISDTRRKHIERLFQIGSGVQKALVEVISAKTKVDQDRNRQPVSEYLVSFGEPDG